MARRPLRALTLVLLASGLKLLDLSNPALLAVIAAVALTGPPLWIWARRSHGLPAFARSEPARPQPAPSQLARSDA